MKKLFLLTILILNSFSFNFYSFEAGYKNFIPDVIKKNLINNSNYYTIKQAALYPIDGYFAEVSLNYKKLSQFLGLEFNYYTKNFLPEKSIQQDSIPLSLNSQYYFIYYKFIASLKDNVYGGPFIGIKTGAYLNLSGISEQLDMTIEKDKSYYDFSKIKYKNINVGAYFSFLFGLKLYLFSKYFGFKINGDLSFITSSGQLQIADKNNFDNYITNSPKYKLDFSGLNINISFFYNLFKN